VSAFNGDLAPLVREVNERVAEAVSALPWDHPVKAVRWVHIDEIVANDYNPNSVARPEMKLLHVSVSADGYTQPCVCIFDPALGKYVLVDGFHRFLLMRSMPDVAATTGGYLPIVVLDKNPEERMASTVRHNRARGKHSVGGMSELVFRMLDEGMSDDAVCNALGLEPTELVRLKHVSGFAKLIESHEYTRAWETRQQVDLKGKWKKLHPEDDPV